MRHRVVVVVTVVWALGAAYLAWAQYRVSEGVIGDDMSWPRSAPYPDRWLAALSEWYDARYPAAPGNVKLHGELPRVRLTVGVALGACLLGAAGSARLWWAGRSIGKRGDG